MDDETPTRRTRRCVVGDVVWTDEAREAVARTLHDIECQGFCDGWDRHEETHRQRYRADAHEILPALAPHLAPMLRAARAEALREAANELARNPGARTPVAELVIENWLRDRAEEVRRGE